MEQHHFKDIGMLCFMVSNAKEALHFYCDLLGFKFLFTFDNPDGSVFMYYLKISDHQYLELIPRKSVFTEEQRFHHVTFLVEDVKNEAKRLLDLGVQLYDGPVSMGHPINCPGEVHSGGDRNPAFYIEDPDHNNIELMQLIPGNIQAQYE